MKRRKKTPATVLSQRPVKVLPRPLHRPRCQYYLAVVALLAGALPVGAVAGAHVGARGGAVGGAVGPGLVEPRGASGARARVAVTVPYEQVVASERPEQSKSKQVPRSRFWV
jgi:hypothetical protein